MKTVFRIITFLTFTFLLTKSQSTYQHVMSQRPEKHTTSLIVEQHTMRQSAEQQVISADDEPSLIYLPTIVNNASHISWAFEETFDGDPASPSQALLPDIFDFAVTHRTHPKDHFPVFDSYLADHDNNCAGPSPDVFPLPQHWVTTSHLSNGASPDESFFICKNHMMSSMGHVEGYSVTSFWPRQEFNFDNGGILEFDVNINDNHPRSWFEIMIVPRSQLKVGAAPENLPIDETYPQDRIVLQYFYNNKRTIHVGTGAIDPEGVIVKETDTNAAVWRIRYPDDPANDDRRIRRTMRIVLEENKITWSIEKEDGSFDNFVAAIPGGLPFTQGLVVFKTHGYTPEKDGNYDNYTFHWDNIRFSGPVIGLYENFEANDVVYLQANGDRQIGEQETITIDLPHIGPNPILFGQVHNPKEGQVLLSINGRPDIVVNPYDYNPGTCSSSGWKSFQLPIDPDWLAVGENSFTWTIGPRPDCTEDWIWNGFSIMGLEVQFELP